MPKFEGDRKILERSARRFAFQFYHNPRTWFPLLFLMIFFASIVSVVLLFAGEGTPPEIVVIIGCVTLILLVLFALLIFLLWDRTYVNRVTIDKITGTLDIQKSRFFKNGEMNPNAIERHQYPLMGVQSATVSSTSLTAPRRPLYQLRLNSRQWGYVVLYFGYNPALAEALGRSINAFLCTQLPPGTPANANATTPENSSGSDFIEADKDATALGPIPEQVILRDSEVIAAVGRIIFILGKRIWEGFDKSLVSESDRRALQQAYTLTQTERKKQIIKIGGSMLWFNAGVIAVKVGMTAEAEGFFAAALARGLKDAGAWSNLGLTRYNLKDFKGAVEAYERVVALKPKDVGAWTDLGDARHGQGDLQGALEAHEEAVALDPKSPKAWHNLGLSRAALKDVKGAADAFKRVISLDPKHISGWANLALARLNLNDIPGAAMAFEQIITINPKNIAGWINLGVARFKLKDFRGAVEAYERALGLDPTNVSAWNNLGLARSCLSDSKGAAAAHERALVLDPKNVHAWLNLGNAQKTQGDLKGAVDAYEHGLALDPNFGDTYILLASARGAQGDLRGAIDLLQKFLAINPSKGQEKAIGVAHYNIACYHALLGEEADSLKFLQQAIAMEPDKYRKLAREDADFVKIKESSGFTALIRTTPPENSKE